jgi:glycosyltransferase involved in cell wall biosynthesis
MPDFSTYPLFSIVVPTLNVAPVVGDGLSSIARQSFGDLEVVVMDGGSNDKTLDVVAGFKSSLGDRLSVQTAQDAGVYDAMNRGVALARGDWLLFLGADDRLHGDDTLTQVAAFIRANSDNHLVYGDVILRSTSARCGGVFDLDALLFKRNICHQAIFYRRELFANLGPYNLRYPIWADWDFNIRCFSNPALVARHMDVVVADYNDTGGLSMKEDTELMKRLPVFILSAARRKWARRAKTVTGYLFPGQPKRGG